MPGKISIVGKVTRQYCEQYPTLSTMALAKMLRRDEPKLYASQDAARDSVRFHRGTKTTGISTKGKAYKASSPIKQISLPDPTPPTWTVHDLPEGPKRWLMLGDIHVPYHSLEALKPAIEYARRRESRCHGLLLMGDTLDFHRLSRFEKDPRARDAAAEVEMANQLIASIRQSLRATHVVYRSGNHEDRLRRYLWQHAPEIAGVAQINLAESLGVDRKHDLWVDAGMPLRHSQLWLLHGSEWRGGISSPVNPARGAYLKARECCVVAHQHRTSSHTEPTISGRDVTTWSLGCCCQLHPDYARLNNWNWGFGILTVDTDGGWHVDNRRIVQGVVV